MKYEDITKHIIGCAMKMHSNLVNGFQKVIYQRAMILEMNLEKFNFECFTRGKTLEQEESVFFYPGENMVELKAAINLKMFI